MRIWRISNFADLSGRGGTLVDGRWNRRGMPIVYCTDHPSTALLEILVHATRETVPETYQLIEIDVPDGIEMTEPVIHDGWDKDMESTRRQGTDFLSANRYALMKIPSIIMRKANNYLLNPTHDDASRITIAGLYHYPFDSRLIK
ncbi:MULTISPECIES: RES family NAD+ phosphorylase [unclassified Mesorhizobium]|uniref:RES family NAD+ phosphorylase n=1 Tax=unclassified Mesorhizobium TaxID=325217 RepID=UPI0020C9E78E|nr:RES family NAD+ phosphorylase [Mesorhizobium sp. LMG 17147]MCP9230498.1 RES family NAD+ phosphorylase [Mesorhizobium sp. LMG 17147]